MKKVGSRELKNRLGTYLARVRAGETIVVTERGRPVAKLTPLSPETAGTKTIDDVLRELAAQGHLRLATRPFADFKPVRAKGKPASQMIIEDRR